MEFKVSLKNKQQFEKNMLTRAKRLAQTANTEARNLVLFGTAFAKLIAPKDTGALALAIRSNIRKNGGEVISGVPKSGRNRPYNMWWHNLGDHQLSKIATERGWNLTGRAPGGAQNMYMTATRKAMGIKAKNSLKIIKNSIRVGG